MGFIFFTHFCDCSINTELINRSNCAKKSFNRFLDGCKVYRQFSTTSALKHSSGQWTRGSEVWVSAFCECYHNLFGHFVPFTLWTIFIDRKPLFLWTRTEKWPLSCAESFCNTGPILMFPWILQVFRDEILSILWCESLSTRSTIDCPITTGRPVLSWRDSLFTYLCDCSVKTELVYRSNFEQNRCNRFLVGTLVDRHFSTSFAFELTSGHWTRRSEYWVRWRLTTCSTPIKDKYFHGDVSQSIHSIDLILFGNQICR